MKNHFIENKSKSLSRIGDRRLEKLKLLNESNEILEVENNNLAKLVNTKNQELYDQKARMLQAISMAKNVDDHALNLEVVHDSLLSQHEKLVSEKRIIDTFWDTYR